MEEPNLPRRIIRVSDRKIIHCLVPYEASKRMELRPFS